jgi:hypothetical protein
MNLRSARHECQLLSLHPYVCGTTEIHKQGTPEVHLVPGSALHMYVALRLFNQHLQSALLQFNFPRVLFLVNKPFKSYYCIGESSGLDFDPKIIYIPLPLSENIFSPLVACCFWLLSGRFLLWFFPILHFFYPFTSASFSLTSFYFPFSFSFSYIFPFFSFPFNIFSPEWHLWYSPLPGGRGNFLKIFSGRNKKF